MNVFYNFELDDGLLLINKKPEAKFIFNDLRKRIIDRIKVLSDEIEAEEKEGTKMIVIVWPLNQANDQLEIVYYHYSKTLTDKLKESLSYEYIQSVFKIISDKIDTFNQ